MASQEDVKELRELVEFLKANDIAEFEMEREDLKVSLKFANAIVPPPSAGIDAATLAALLSTRPAAVDVAAVGGGNPSLSASAPAISAAAAAPAGGSTEQDPLAGAHIVKSPIVGTFYAAPSPDAEPFVKMGDRVTTGKVLCIVEAMKLMNEIEADASGEIVKVFLQSGQPVEYGQPLFAIR